MICKDCVKDEPTLKNCPTCGGSPGNLGCLERNQPLAHRILGKIKVACPLRGEIRNHSQIGCGCQWVGEYHELEQHLDTAHRGCLRMNKSNTVAQAVGNNPFKKMFARSASVDKRKESNNQLLQKSDHSIAQTQTLRPEDNMRRDHNNMQLQKSDHSIAHMQNPKARIPRAQSMGNPSTFQPVIQPPQKPRWLEKQMNNKATNASVYSGKGNENKPSGKKVSIQATPIIRQDARQVFLSPQDPKRKTKRSGNLDKRRTKSPPKNELIDQAAQRKDLINQSATEAYKQGIRQETELRARDHIQTTRQATMGQAEKFVTSGINTNPSPSMNTGSAIERAEHHQQQERRARRRSSIDNSMISPRASPIENVVSLVEEPKPELERNNSPRGLVPDTLLPGVSEFSNLRRALSSPDKIENAPATTAQKASAGWEIFNAVDKHSKDRRRDTSGPSKPKSHKLVDRTQGKKFSTRRKNVDRLGGSNHCKQSGKVPLTRKVKRRPSLK